MTNLARAQYDAALAMVEREDVADFAKAEMLVEIAMGLQSRPRAAEDFALACALYERALEFARDEPALQRARIQARQATAHSMDPLGGLPALQQARDLLQSALPELHSEGLAEEAAEAELNLGLTLQSLASEGAAPMTEAIAAYQRALQVFTAADHAVEFAILHNNLATAYLAMRGDAAAEKVREALAVQAFESALAQLNKLDNPKEFAMLQNNLGNALQYAASGHALENNLRALDAYEAALEIRTERDSPAEFANTMANLGNCLANLPAEVVEFDPQARALECLKTAQRVFVATGQADKAAMLRQSHEDLLSHAV